MSRFLIGIGNVRRRSSALVSCVLLSGAMGLALSACSRDREVVQASDDAPIRVETTQLFVTIENRAGGALLDISVAILPVGFPPFTRLISRLENAEKRDLSLSDFTSRDGTTFNLRLVRPKTVRVTATDLTNKKYEVEVPWK